MSFRTWESFLALGTRICLFRPRFGGGPGALGQPNHYYLRRLYVLMCVCV